MDMAWSNGYQTEVNYTYGYYRDLSPNYQRFCLLLNGVDCPSSQQSHHHCELGFGQGVSINIHAAGSDSIFWGTDFNPAHAAHADQLADYSHAQHYYFDDSFEELFNRSDLPQFDSISLHGIWSWISYENQLIILKFIRTYLKPNGIVYISYNCETGWAASMPVRELLYSHYKYASKSHSPVKNVQDALDFSEALLLKDPLLIKQNPLALSKLKSLKEKNPNYLIHEYFNKDWKCFSFQQIVRLFEEIKLSYAGTTDLLVHVEQINFSPEQTEFLNRIEHPILKEQCRDYFTAAQFRRDLYIRGKNILTPLQCKQRLREYYFVALRPVAAWPNTIQGILGEFNLIEEIYSEIGRIYVEEHYRAISIAELEQRLPDLSYEKILNALVVLCHCGYMQPCQHNQASESVLQRAHKLNTYLLEQSQFHRNYTVLVNPLTGMGIEMTQFEQLTYLCYFFKGLKTAEEVADYIQNVLDQLALFMFDENKNIVREREKSIARIRDSVSEYLNPEKLQIIKQLQLFNPEF
ncbi:class I SAM-dependent methyltransferase [Acinetobacter larvae]|uniref:Methyltransferase regulatory domain protein n=1 Tax=Acinetobacter larvae TaxID=1789224 RepID=A0A1B2M0L3_9GAMM|nr:class I SAM-dependent methyltransferase [Acinetobacter larvae]AOA58746.1 methyltransferase regulatory domain protein [Acinetobacter larvae]